MKRPEAPFPLVTLGLSATIAAVYGLELSGDGRALCAAYGFVAARPSFETALSSLLVHDPATFVHVGGNLVFLVVLGSVVERAIGGLRFLAVFAAAGLVGCVFHWLVSPGSDVPLVGMSGSLTGLMAVAATIKPRVFLGFVVTYIAMNVLGLFVSTPLMPAETSLACHVGGFSAGVLVVLLTRFRGVDLRLRAARAA